MNDIEPSGHWGRQPFWPAKVGTRGSTVVIIKRARKFTVNQTVQFAEYTDLQGMSTGCTPRWRHGRIWKIDIGMLFISLT